MCLIYFKIKLTLIYLCKMLFALLKTSSPESDFQYRMKNFLRRNSADVESGGGAAGSGHRSYSSGVYVCIEYAVQLLL